MSRIKRKSAFCICQNKDADQLCGNPEADQRLCFRYIAITIPLLHKYKIPHIQPYSVVVQPGLCGTWSETPKTGFLTTITKTSPCNEYPLTPHFYIVKLGYTGAYFFLIFALKYRLWVLVRTASLRRL